MYFGSCLRVAVVTACLTPVAVRERGGDSGVRVAGQTQGHIQLAIKGFVKQL